MKLPLNIVKFWSKVQIGQPDQCWPWIGAKSNGYGIFEKIKTHRIAYMLAKGPIPVGLMVRHTCDNRPCCNPAHLLTGTNADNHRDACERRRWLYGLRNGNAKLTDEQVDYIRSNPDRHTQRALANEFGVAESTISYIRRHMRRPPDPVRRRA